MYIEDGLRYPVNADYFKKQLMAGIQPPLRSASAQYAGESISDALMEMQKSPGPDDAARPHGKREFHKAWESLGSVFVRYYTVFDMSARILDGLGFPTLSVRLLGYPNHFQLPYSSFAVEFRRTGDILVRSGKNVVRSGKNVVRSGKNVRPGKNF